MRKIAIVWAVIISLAVGFQYYNPFDESGTEAVTALDLAKGDTVTEAKMDQIDTNDAYLDAQIEGLKDGTVALTTPALGTPASGVGTNITGIDSASYVNGSIDAAHLAADIIDETKIADDGIDSEHYNDGSIDTAHIAADQITSALIADDQIDSEHYVAASIDNEHLADDAVGTDEIATDAVTIDAVDVDGNFTTLTGNWATTGELTGRIKVATSSITYPVGGAMLYGGLLVHSGNQQTVTLGAVAAGMSFCVVADGADGSAEVYLDCDASDHFEYDGTTMSDGEYIYNDSDTKGDRICVVGIDSSTWLVTYGGDTTVAEETP